MKKIVFIIACLMAVSTLQAKVAMSHYLTVKEGKMGKFMDLAAAKTKKYNSKKGQPIYYTFQIVTGPNAQQLWRVQVAPKIDDFDTVDTKGNNYWQETVGNLHTTRNTQMLSFNENASHDPGGSDVNMLSRMLFYTISNKGSKGFWKFRMRVARVMKEMNSDLSMFVWNCNSGCNGNVVLVSFGHKNYADQRMDNETEYPKLVEKHNEMFGRDTYEDDLGMLDESLEDLWGRCRSYAVFTRIKFPSRHGIISLKALLEGFFYALSLHFEKEKKWK